MKLRPVVTCFLRRPGDGKVLLGRRSRQVHTYKEHWAGISGALEEVGPLPRAYREIREETGLDRDEVELLATGRCLRFPDWELGVLWAVHPYLFRCRAPDEVRSDWEHLEFGWRAPERIRELRTVPRLWEAYRSAAEAEGKSGGEYLFEQVRSDREHGAHELGLWTLEALQREARDAGAESASELMAAVRNSCRKALELRPSMAPVRSAALEGYRTCRDALAGEPDRPAPATADALLELIRRRESASLQAGATAADQLPDAAHLLTISRSSTVLYALHEAAEKTSRLTVAESRPACEGRSVARTAAEFGIEVELVTDAVAARLAEAADGVLFGADSVMQDGSIVNKAGTYALCCGAARGEAMTLCVTTADKVLPAGLKPQMEQMDPAELGEEIPGVSRRNVYFETVAADLVDTLVLGRRVASRGEPAQIARRRHDLRRELE